jgi:hypothetical protein
LPRQIQEEKVEFIEKVSFRLIAITMGAIFLFALFVTRFQISDYQKRLKNARLHLAAVSEIGYLQGKISLREGLMHSIQEERIPIDGLLKVVSASLPPEIILSELTLDQNSRVLLLKGIISARENIAEDVLVNFMQKLEKSSFITEVALVSSKKAENAQEFEVRADLVR